ncbi:MAG: hypothetical protein ACR2QS_16410 [Woeseiaceae bacterium]
MSDELDKLKRDYQAISAPPHLATRIRASVADSRTRSSFWMPAAVTCTAIVALFWVVPFTTQVTNDEAAKPTRPSLSAIAALKPTKPSVSTPSLSQLRSVSVPAMPAKPKTATPPKSQTINQIENEPLKEKDNAYI